MLLNTKTITENQTCNILHFKVNLSVCLVMPSTVKIIKSTSVLLLQKRATLFIKASLPTTNTSKSNYCIATPSIKYYGNKIIIMVSYSYYYLFKFLRHWHGWVTDPPPPPAYKNFVKWIINTFTKWDATYFYRLRYLKSTKNRGWYKICVN